MMKGSDMEMEVLPDMTTYTEGNYRIEMTINDDPDILMFIYHNITTDHPCIILNSEMRQQVCVNCGPLNVPDSLQALWFMFHMDGGNK